MGRGASPPVVPPILLWFRRDLRLHDNPALHWAVAQGAPVVPLYIHDPEDGIGAASRWWLHHSLIALAEALAQRGLRLHCLRGAAAERLPEAVAASGAGQVVWNRLYEPWQVERDRRLATELERGGVRPISYPGQLWFEPGEILNGSGAPYRVFTAFWRQARRRLEERGGSESPEIGRAVGGGLPGAGGVDSLGLLGCHPWHERLHHHWLPGEAAARRRLQRFLAELLPDYGEGRERPDRDGTSRLSPHLHFGELSPARLFAELLPFLHGEAGPRAAAAAERWLAELGWREFAHHVLWHFPETVERSMDRRFGDGFWEGDPAHLEAWRRGRTGVALVDAGMRQLWESGWMHNRVRMVVGSLLTKNLGIHWRAGASWFADTLVDADMAINTLSWQWVAGCGVDAAPYFRIFNPDTQARRFDPDGGYRRRWLDGGAGPPPIIDLAASRRAALARYRELVAGG